MTIGADQDILGLEVAVDDTGSMQAIDTFNDLCGVEASSISTKSSPPCQLGGEVASGMEILSLGQSSYP